MPDEITQKPHLSKEAFMLEDPKDKSKTVEVYPIGYDKPTNKWITIKGEHDSWHDSLKAIGLLRQDNKP